MPNAPTPLEGGKDKKQYRATDLKAKHKCEGKKLNSPLHISAYRQ